MQGHFIIWQAHIITFSQHSCVLLNCSDAGKISCGFISASVNCQICSGFGSPYTNMLKIFMKQIPIWTVRKQAKWKYILHPHKANVVQKF